MGQGRLRRRERDRHRLPVLRGHLVSQPHRRARLRPVEGRPARVGAPGVVAAAEPHDRRGGRDRPALVRALPRDPPERRMNPYPPHLLDRRLGVARGVLWAAMGVLAAAFFRAQILEHGKYQLQSETNRLRPIPLPAPRGVILDRNGRVLAENVPGYTVSLLPAEEVTLRRTLGRIAPIVRLDSPGIDRVLVRYRRAAPPPPPGPPGAPRAAGVPPPGARGLVPR